MSIEVRDLRLRFGDVDALDGLSFSLAGGKIYGLLGRNGSGKTSLLSVLAAFRRPTSGEVLINGAEPFENAGVVSQICLIRESGDVYDNERVASVLRAGRQLRRDWDSDYAEKLLERFQLSTKKRVQSLSRGQKSALGIVVGLASRAPLTMFDESYLGMDAPSRYAFYEELLADYTAHPRTFVISTHLIEEVASLFEEVIIIDRGRLVLHEESDALRGRGVTVTGPADVVDTFVASLTVLGQQTLGRTKAATIYGELNDTQVRAAKLAGLELGPVALQDLFVHLTRAEAEGIVR
ncbi:ABC transporter [Rhizocola hellebori]|uniref:ABC transporter n=1 Tax=Rhizocola hellebori TaxID=1392758 RepID=A0A8J3QFR4_9ACTN|nr:ABC transporter ATP-binding protein [Rhizocola hellebori]GIH08797.1 ABC transporter [Rhizocola hellebori]